jgi:thioredoxin reductase
VTAPVAFPVSADVVVIGAGPAGIAAATRIAEIGRRVVLFDESPAVGGQIWRHRSPDTLTRQARRWIARLERSGATIVCGASVVDVRRDGAPGRFVVTAERGGRPCLSRARAIVLATGARERFLPFPGWTLPGVLGVGAAQALLKSGASFAGKRVVVAGSGPLLLPVAAALVADGAHLPFVAEQAPSGAVAGFALGLWRRPAALLQAGRYRAGFRSTPYRPGWWVAAARGDGRVQEVALTDGHATRTLSCDLLCAAYGLVPNTELARSLGCAVRDGAVVVDDRQVTSAAGVYCAGETAGVGGVDLALVEGEIAGLVASDRNAEALRLHPRRAALRRIVDVMDRAFALRAELRAVPAPSTIVCRCEDVALGAIDPAWSPRQAKLYTRAGMGPCQGRICGAALEWLHGWAPDVVRLPAEPALLSTILADAGDPAHSIDQGA